MSSLINFSGIASGIDSSGLIKAMLDSERSRRVAPLENKISTLQESSTKLGELKTLLTTLKDKAQVFRSIQGGVVSKSGASSDESVATVTASNSATSGSYSLNSSQLARSATFSFNDRFASDGTAVNSAINNGASTAARTVSITIGTGSEQEQVDIALTSSTTLAQIASSFNEQSAQGEATVVNVGTSASPSFALVISSNNSGTARGQIGVSVGSEITTAGGGTFATSTTSQAQDATFTLSGVTGTITRSTNEVSDVIQGVTLSLRSAGSASLTVTNDASVTGDAVQEFVDAYNDVVQFIAENDRVIRDESGGEPTNIFSALANTSIDENILGALRASLSGSAVSGGSVSTLADAGITTARDGTLSFDRDTFESALQSDASRVQSLFEGLGDDLGTVDGTIAQFTRFNGIIDSETNSYAASISSYNDRLSEVEKYLSKEEQSLTARYARLESLIGRLNSQSSSLSSLA